MTTAPLQNDRFGTDRFAASREVAGPSGRFGLDRLRPSAAHADVREFGERLVVWVEFADSTELIRLTSGTSSLLERAIDTACAQRIPLVMVMTSAGADIVDGPAVSGPALLLGLADIAVMTSDSYAFVQGPTMVEQFTGVAISTEELGGAANHARYTGVPSAVVADRAAAIETVETILSYLPGHVDEEPPRWPSDDPADRLCPEAGTEIPESSTGSYDVRKVAAAIADEDSVFELRDRWAANVITAFATIGGRPVGIVANQPISLAGTLDIPASQKSARFVSLCDAFNLPIITLVDTPGFYPGKDLEWRGMIRHGAQLVFAYAQATVPRICVILRKSYGGAYIVMDSKTMGNDLCLAWPWAEIAVMGAGQAAAILARRSTPEEKAEFERDYAERLLNPYVAAERGFIDAVIEPADTRREICAALSVLEDKREMLIDRKHGNSPL